MPNGQNAATTKGNTMQNLAAYNKAIVATIMTVILLANTFLNTDWRVSQETVNAFVAAVTPVLVFLIPNKPKAE
jgi:hypothetical protein